MLNLKNSTESPSLISPRTLMLTIGVLGFILPIVLIVGAVIFQDCEVTQNSISAYYHTGMRNILVGAIFAIAICFYAYEGYHKIDNIAGNLAALFAIGVALFPTSIEAPFTKCLNISIDNGMVGRLHFISAALLFITLSFFSLYLFTRSNKGNSKSARIKRKIYRTCGILMLLFISLIALYHLFLKVQFPFLSKYSPVFWLETLTLWSFSISWLVKSNNTYK